MPIPTDEQIEQQYSNRGMYPDLAYEIAKIPRGEASPIGEKEVADRPCSIL